MGVSEAIHFDNVDELSWSFRNSKKACAWLAGLYLVRKSFRLGSLVLSAFPWICLLSDLHPGIELINHTSMHAFVVVCLALPIAVLVREYLVSVPLAVAFLLLFGQLQPLNLISNNSTPNATFENTVSVVSWNMLATNENFDGLRNLLQEHTPDLVVLIELRPGVLERTECILEQYPHYRYRPSWGGEGIGIFSRHPNIEFEFEDFGFAKQPALVASISNADGASLRLVGMHTLSPLPLERVATRDKQLKELAAWAQHTDGPIAVCGDFNISPWTTPFKNLLAAGFVDSREGSGNGASWPAELGFLGVPIDHVLSHGDCQIRNRKVLGPVEGSDHKPVYFEVQF